MARARFWTGVVLLMSPVTGVVIANCGNLLEPWASVRGRVTYRGHPVHSGFVMFVSEDREQSSDMLGHIDRNGYYSAQPRWWHARGEPARFRIEIYPDPRESRREARKAALARPGVDLRLASIGLMATPAPPPSAALTSRRGRREDKMGELAVSLRSEPVLIEIDLRD